MSDLIDRLAAIAVINGVFPVDPMKSEYAQGIACGAALAKTYVEQLPSVQSDRKRGKWIDDGDPFMWECGCCGYRVKRYNNTRYCPNCGADMREDDHETD